jgi:lipopolysaccharide export system protein LptA
VNERDPIVARMLCSPKAASGNPRRPWRRIRWQGFARSGLALGLTVFSAVVFLGIRDRVDPVARAIDRSDPEAVIEITGAKLVQSAGDQENFTLQAGTQLTYTDGSIRFVDGVTLRVSELNDRDSFVIVGTDATVNDSQTGVSVNGDVRLVVADGLRVQTDTANYATGAGLITMPGQTALTREGFEASGHGVVYDGDQAVVHLLEAARVGLIGKGDLVPIDITSARATLAHTAGYMFFEEGAEVHTGPQVLESDEITAHFGDDETALERLELRGSARIHSTIPTSGGLRTMEAGEMSLSFGAEARGLERAMLVDTPVIELVGTDGGRGARIGASTMDVALGHDGGGVTGLMARYDVRLELPETADGARQEIRALTLTGTGAPKTGLTAMRFDEQVEYRERRPAPAVGGAPTNRVILAELLEAGVEAGLSAMPEARFKGNVRFDDETRQAVADKVEYDVTAGRVILGRRPDRDRHLGGAADVTPRLTDATGTIEAPSIEIALDGSTVDASGGVKSMLSQAGGDDEVGTGSKRPALLGGAETIFVSADTLHYDGASGEAAYTGQARLWQGETSFQGDSLTVDNETGALEATGDVQTNIQLLRLNETTQQTEISLTRAEAGTFMYDETTHVATYDEKAVLRSEYGDLKANTIEVFLEPDGRTLERLEATGNVKLHLDGRWANGDRLVYYEAEGRYEMEGEPVEIVEEKKTEETTAIVPPRLGEIQQEPMCRTTSGLALTFYRSTDTVSVDGREERRTSTESGKCQPQTF